MTMKFENRPYTWDEIEMWDDPEWLVEGLVHRGSSVFLHGAPKTGKSLFALRLAAAVTTGMSLFGHRTERGNVLYLAAERARLTKPRMQAAIQRGIPFDPSRFLLWAKPVSFRDSKEVEHFVRRLGGWKPDLLIVDTLRRCFKGGREIDNNDMGEWAMGVELFCELTGSSAVVIHHNHRDRRDAYGRVIEGDFAGGGSLLGTLDGQFALRVNNDGTIHISTEAANEGNHFDALVRTEPEIVGTHQTWVMLEVERPAAEDETKPNLWLLASEVLRRNPGINQTRWTKLCREDEQIKRWWPDLNRSTVTTLVNEHRAELHIEKHGRQKLCWLIEDAA